MLLPTDREIIDLPTAWLWNDDDGILCMISKDNPPELSEEMNEKINEQFISIIGGRKVCMLIDVKHSKPSSAAERKRSSEILNPVTNAMAIIIHNPMGRMLINLFVGLQKPPYPIKIFKPGESAKAKEWLMQYNKDA